MRGPSGMERAWQDEAAAAEEGGLPTLAGGVAQALLPHPEIAYLCLPPEDLAGNQKARHPGAVIHGGQLPGAKGRAGNSSGGTIGNPLASQASLLLDSHDFRDEGHTVASSPAETPGAASPSITEQDTRAQSPSRRRAVDLTALPSEAGPSLTFPGDPG